MNFPDKLRDTNSGLNITKTGCQYVNGVESLELVRSRDTSYFANGQWNYDGLGDLSRVRRQQAFFHALIDRADGDRNPLSINAFIIDATKQIVIDSTFTTGDLESLALEFRGLPSANLSTEVLPTAGQPPHLTR